jgi:hypothetical protein
MRHAWGVAVLLGALVAAGCSNDPCDFGNPYDPCGGATCQPGTYCLADAGPLSCSPAKPLDAPCNRSVECVSLTCLGPADAGELGPFFEGGHCAPRACF